MNGDIADTLERLRGALREAGYGEIVDDEAEEARFTDRSPAASLRQLISMLQDAVVPAMRATAEASRLLADHVPQDVSLARSTQPLDDPTAIRLTLDPVDAETRAVAAGELERLLGELRRSIDADNR